MSAPGLMRQDKRKVEPMPIDYVAPAIRDRSRRAPAKGRAMTRRAARRDKSARLFLAWAFPADMGER